MIEVRRRTVVPSVLVLAGLLLPLASGAQYTPERHNWETRRPGEVGMNATLVEEAVQMAIDGETPGTHDMALSQQLNFGREPHSEPIGPFRTRGEAAGIIIRNGHIVAEWGDPYRVDMTHSVSKSFLSTTVGLAWADGLIDGLDDPVSPYMAPVLLPEGDGERNLRGDSYSHEPVTLFEDEHNQKITWRNLLQQNSAWRGTLWGKPDWADRPAEDRSTWLDTDRPKPGTVYEYNDTRVNLFGLADNPSVAGATPERPQAKSHGSNWRFEHLALARIRKFLDHPRWRKNPSRERWRSLGRRHVLECP